MPSLQKHELGFYFLIAILKLDKESLFLSSYGVLSRINIMPETVGTVGALLLLNIC